MRALYQRKKGRDLFDLAYALQNAEVNPEEVVRCYKRYIGFVVETPPTNKQFVANMEEKMMDPDFIGDTEKLLRPGVSYDPYQAWELVKASLVDIIR